MCCVFTLHYCVFMFSQGLLTFVYITLLSASGERVAARMRKQLFQSIVSQDIAFFDGHKTGEIVNRWVAIAKNLIAKIYIPGPW